MKHGVIAEGVRDKKDKTRQGQVGIGQRKMSRISYGKKRGIVVKM